VFRFSRLVSLALFALVAQLCALGADVAVLRNGFSITHLRREQIGDKTRLYTAEGYVDIPTDQIVSIEKEYVPPPQPADPQPQQAAFQPQPAPMTATTAAKTPVDLDQVVRDASNRQRLDPDFVNSVIKAESNFKTRAVSPKGAQGLMQLMPATAAQLGVTDPFDPKANVEAGTAYLNDLLNLYHDDPIKALAAYNAGTVRVQQYHGVPPYRETRSYIARIVRDFNAKKKAKMTPAPVQAKKTAATQTAHKATRKKKAQQQAKAAAPQSPGGNP